MQKIRFIPTEAVPPGYRDLLTVETVPNKGDTVFLNGVPFVVNYREFRYVGGSENAGLTWVNVHLTEIRGA